MPAHRTFIHKRDEADGKKRKSEAYFTHLCRHCRTHVPCRGDAHAPNPDECPFPPDFTCDTCGGLIETGDFRFGSQTEGCNKGCKFNSKEGYFEHDSECPKHWSQGYREGHDPDFDFDTWANKKYPEHEHNESCGHSHEECETEKST